MPINPISGLFQRVWKFVDQFAAGDDITRADLDDALDDFVPAINQALEQRAAAEAAALAAQGHAEAAATAGAAAGAVAGAEAATIAAAEQVALASAFAQEAELARDAALSGPRILTAADDGIRSTGTYTPTPIGGNYRRIVNGGAFTLSAPVAAGDYELTVQITNNASAGTITFSGFNRVTGDALTNTNGDDFLLVITKINGFTLCERKALQ